MGGQNVIISKRKITKLILFIILVTLLFWTRNVKQFFVHFCIPENTCSPHTNRNKAEVTLWRMTAYCRLPMKRSMIHLLLAKTVLCATEQSCGSAIMINQRSEAIMFQNLWPTLTIANVCSSASLRISVKAAPHWSIHYCQGKFYFLNKKTPDWVHHCNERSWAIRIWVNSELIETVCLWPEYEFWWK